MVSSKLALELIYLIRGTTYNRYLTSGFSRASTMLLAGQNMWPLRLSAARAAEQNSEHLNPSNCPHLCSYKQATIQFNYMQSHLRDHLITAVLQHRQREPRRFCLALQYAKCGCQCQMGSSHSR